MVLFSALLSAELARLLTAVPCFSSPSLSDLPICGRTDIDLLSSFEITFSMDRDIRPVPVEGLGGGIEAVEETGGSGGLAEAVSRDGGLLPFSSFSLGNSTFFVTPLSVCF